MGDASLIDKETRVSSIKSLPLLPHSKATQASIDVAVLLAQAEANESTSSTITTAFPMATTPVLPTDLLHLLCIELAEQLEVGALFNCAVSSKVFAAAGALSNLYKICSSSSVSGGDHETFPMHVQELLVQKWSILWRSILLSSLGKTMYPYCRYLRVLDLRNLNFLLEDEKFRGKIAKNFFSGGLARFDMKMDTPFSAKGPRRPRLNVRGILLAVGDAITQQAPMLEVLTEPVMPGLDVFSSALLDWPLRLENLQFLQLGDGKALADDRIQESLVSCCPHLNKLEIYQWMNDDSSDQHLARFLLRMKPNTLEFFQNESECGIGLETCKAFAHHATSLVTLHLAISDMGLQGLGELQPCTAIESLTLTDLKPPTDLKATQNDVFSGMVAWLTSLHAIRDITLSNFISAPALLTPVLEKTDIALDYLQINASENSLYMVKDNQDFHRAIGRQSNLTSLLLKADADGAFGDDVETLCNCICGLEGLKRLSLTRITEYFSDNQIARLSEHLPSLEELLIDGYGITDLSLERLSGLPYLKSLGFSGLTQFSLNGLLDFVEKLTAGNEGLVLSVDRAQINDKLSDAEQEIVREAIVAKVNGRFEYTLVRDPDISDFEASDSD